MTQTRKRFRTIALRTLLLTAACIARIVSADVAVTALHPDRVVYCYHEMLNFRLDDYLRRQAPHLLPQADRHR